MFALLERLKEPSTMAGLSVVLFALGVPVPPGSVEMVGQVLSGMFGLAAIFMKEKK